MGRGLVRFRQESDERAWRRWGRWRFVAGVRGKAGFTHDMDHFGHGVREKRFSTHGTLEKQIDNQMEGRGK